MATDTSPQTLTLPISLNIRSIGGVHDLMLDVLSKHDSIIVDIPDEAQADLSFIQLMESSCRYARTQGKTITLKKPAGAGVMETLQRGGFLTEMDQASRLFWLHGKEIQ